MTHGNGPAPGPGAAQSPTWSGGPTSPDAVGRAAPGVTIGGRYTLRTAVGHGGMGTVWRAADTLLHRDVAVKEVILPPGLADSDRDAMYERTLREARAAAALQHPAVVQVYDVVTDGGRPWIVMELLDARSLADMVIEDGPLAPRAVAKIGIALLGALEVAHAIGVLHRDVKPANVLICADGRCVLTDFGVARMPTDVQLTTPGMVLGSPHFISPERAMGQDFGPPSDLFSLGVTLYTAVEGRPPFDKGDPIETMHSVVEDPPAPITRAGVLSEVLLGLLEKDPARRLDAESARTMLRTLLAGPLASSAPAHLMTDPYAVVPRQRVSGQPTVAEPAPAQPTGQIGGRAMIAPGESLTDRLAQLRDTDRRSPTAATNAAPAGALGTPTGAMAGALATPTGQLPQHDRPQVISGDVWPSHTVGGPTSAGSSPGARLDNALAGLSRTGGTMKTTVKGWSRTMKLAAAGGLAAVLLIGAMLLFGGGSEEPTNPIARNSPSAPAGPDFETTTYEAHGMSVNVPEGWTKSAPKGAVYVDFRDPQVDGRRVRILVEKGNAEPVAFMKIAEKGLKKNTDACPPPYARVHLQDIKLDEKPAAELEYTCGEGADMRHGIWAAVPHGGRIYSFYLTTTDQRFADSKKYFDEMVRSFRLTADG